VVALAVLRLPLPEPGADVTIHHGDATWTARVAALPL
jgi:hypothetical protein